MEYGFCNLSVVPVRKQPSSLSEMTSQLLFGEIFQIVRKQDEWLQIKIFFDGYEGWINQTQFKPISNETFIKLSNISPDLSTDLVQLLIDDTNKFVIPVLMGSSLPYLVNNSFYIEETKYIFEGQTVDKSKLKNRNNIAETAYMYLNAPYLWGGRSPFGIDCSGFTQMVFKINGMKLLRDASQQASCGDALSFPDEAQQGDLAFFENDEKKIIHVGIILGKSQVIHASGKVRIDKIDNRGIFNSELNNYTHTLKFIRKIL
ncbi:MAG: C40 family peptidase [Bacteroidales bacterium]|nr:C40 family peptidase [Bacteroidales bacterium]